MNEPMNMEKAPTLGDVSTQLERIDKELLDIREQANSLVGLLMGRPIDKEEMPLSKGMMPGGVIPNLQSYSDSIYLKTVDIKDVLARLELILR